jgi:hypothetical protein
MADEPENLVVRYLRRLDEKVDQVSRDIGEVKSRLQTRVTSLDGSIVHVHERLDGIQQQIGGIADRIERRLSLADA